MIETTQPATADEAHKLSTREADEALIALARRTQQAHKAARIEAIVREPDR